MKAKRFCQCGTELERSKTKDGRAARWPKYCSPECQAEAYKINQPTAVYILANALGEPIYVGVSSNLKQRMIAHKATKDWWESVANIDFEDFTNRLEAEVREAELIKKLKPAYNRAIPIDPTSTPDAPANMNRVLVVFSDGLLSELDSARGLVSRSAWIRQAVEDKLMKEAVAPLVPTFKPWEPSDVVYDGEPRHRIEQVVEVTSLEPITPNEFDAHKAKPKRPFRCPDCLDPTPHERGDCPAYQPSEPKPKARRKVKPPKEYDFAKDRPEGCVCTYDMLGRIWNSACKIHDSASDRTQRYVDNLLPARCNRGACTGTIKPNGRCIRCNQEPLKESK